MSARGEHEAEGRAVEAHQEAKHTARDEERCPVCGAPALRPGDDCGRDYCAQTMAELAQKGYTADVTRPVALDEAEAADLLDVLADCAELAEQTGRPWLAENVRAALRLLNKRGEEALSD